MTAPLKPPSPSRRTPRAKRLRPARREQRAKYLRVLPALNERELEVVLELWDDLDDDMRGVRVRWIEPEAPPPAPHPPHIAPLLSVPPLPEGCAGEADEAAVPPRHGTLPVIIELEAGAGDPPPDLNWADLAGDDEWQVEPPPNPASSVPEQGWLF